MVLELTFSSLRRLFVTRVGPLIQVDVPLLSDEPISDSAADYFGFATFATALAEIIDNEGTGTPLTIALSAPWGAGKTSVAKMIENELRDRVDDRKGAGRRIICRFNAWEHDDAPHLGAALAAQVARTANEGRPRWLRLFRPLPAAMLEPRERWWRIVCLGVIAALVAGALVVLPPTREVAGQAMGLKETVVSGLGLLGLLWMVALLWGVVFKTARNASRFVGDPSSEAARGSMAEVKRQLGRLIKKGMRGGRIVIFVDDLERCRAARSVEVFEVASQLLAHQGVVTVLLADMRSLSDAAKVAYSKETENKDPEMGRRYLEKLVQLELDLPPPAVSDMKLLLGGEKPISKKKDEVEVESRSWVRSADTHGRLGLLVAAAVTIGVMISLVVMVSWSSGVGDVAVIIAIGGALISSAGMATQVLSDIWGRWRRLRVAERVQATLRDHPDSVSGDTATSESLLREAAGSEKYEPLAGQVAESVRTMESMEVKEVEAFIKRYPPPFPRGAKRMLNHARLLTKIAREREMFGGEPSLTPQHLGKWIVIGERWPDVAERAARRPDEIEKLEKRLSGARKTAPEMPRGGLGHSDQEFKQLIAEEPKLSEMIERLVYFRPAVAFSSESPVSASPVDS